MEAAKGVTGTQQLAFCFNDQTEVGAKQRWFKEWLGRVLRQRAIIVSFLAVLTFAMIQIHFMVKTAAVEKRALEIMDECNCVELPCPCDTIAYPKLCST